MCQRYANAPMMLLSIHTQWPLLDPSERNMFLQQWSVELPYMVSMLGPVLAEAQALDGIHHETRTHRRDSKTGRSSGRHLRAAINELNRRSQIAASLSSFNTSMTANTINFTRTMSNH